MSKTKVSKLIRVRTGRNIVELELVGDKLNIQVGDTSRITLNSDAVNVLREMLGLQKVGSVLATTLPPGSITEQERKDAEHASPDLEGDGDSKEGMA